MFFTPFFTGLVSSETDLSTGQVELWQGNLITGQVGFWRGTLVTELSLTTEESNAKE